MKPLFRLWALLLFVPLSSLSPAHLTQQGQYSCIPCGYDCDKEQYTQPGTCPHCKMELVKTSTIRFKTIQPEAICDYIKKHPGVILLDVRTPEEFAGKGDPDFGSLKNAVNIPVQELTARIKELAPYKKKTIIVYCSHSHRSPRAAYMLNQQGFANVYNMAGGMSVFNGGPCKK